MRRFLYLWVLVACFNTGTAQINLTVQDTETCNSTVSVPITIGEDQFLGSLAFVVNWDDSGLEFVDITPSTPIGTVVPNSIPPNTFIYTWTQPGAGYEFSAGETVVIFNFTVTGPPGNYSVSIAQTPFPPRAFDPSFVQIPVTSHNGIVTAGSDAPVFQNCPGPIVMSSDPGVCGANVNWTAPTVADCDNNADPIVPSGVSPGFLAVGNHVATYTVTDSDNNTATCTVNITVNDTEAPSLSCPDDISVNVTPGTMTHTVPAAELMPTTSDNCGSTTVSYSFSGVTPGSGTYNGQDLTFNTGSTTVTYVSSDGTNDSAPCMFTVTITESAANPITLDIGDVTTDGCSNEITVPIVILEDRALVSLQFTIEFDGTGLTLVSFLDATNDGNVSYGPLVPPPHDFNDMVSYSWSKFPARQFSAGDVIANMTFTVAPNVGSTYDIDFNLAQNIDVTIKANESIFDPPIVVNTQNGSVTVGANDPPTVSCPPAISVECGASTAPANTGMATGMDDCVGTLIPTFSDGALSNGCGNTGTITRTWTANDGSGNTTTCNQTITIQDTTNPTFDNPPPGTVNINCNDPIPAPQTLTASDNCDPAPTVSATRDPVTPNLCTGYSITYRWTATDDCGNSTVVTQVINVAADNAGPTFNSTPPGTVNINCNDPVPAQQTLSANDNCGSATVVPSADPFTPNLCTGYSITYRWTATDDCGNSTVATQIINVLPDNTDPTFDNPPPGTVNINCNDPVPTQQQLSASDNCDNDPTVSATRDAFTVDLCNGYSITNRWTATDDCGNSTVVTQVINVLADNTDPTFNSTPTNIGNINCNDPLPTQQTLTASDNCGTASVVPSVDPFTANTCTGYSVTYRWTATDQCNNSTVITRTFTVLPDNTNPTFNAPGDVSINCAANPLDLSLTGDVTNESDNCSTNLDATFTDDNSGANGCNGPGQIIRTWTLTDDCGNSVSQNQTITLVNDIPASFTAPPAISINCQSDPTILTLTGDVINEFSPCATNPQATFSDNTSGLTGCNGTGQIIRTWTLDDGCSSPVTHVQVITVVDNTAPTFTAPADVTINCEDDATSLVLTGDVTNESDNCSTNLNATFTDNTTGLTGCNGTGDITRTWTLEDDCGNSVSHNQTITVVDNTPPTFTVPGPITINCLDDPTDLSITGDVSDESDNCSTNLEATFSDDNSGSNGCISPGDIIRTWTVEDDCGNTLSQTQTITLVNTIPASFTVPPAVTINCEDDAIDLTLTGDVTDEFSPCATNQEATFTDNTSGLTGCNGTGQIIRTWTLDDGCSNPVIHDQIITVVDTESPTFTAPAEVTINCDDDPTNLTLTGDVTNESDNCSTNLDATFSDDLSGLTGCNGTGQIMRSWTLEDDCGNTVTHTQTINVIDNTPPTFTVPGPVTINCADDPTDLSLTGDVTDESDNCSTNLEATFTDDNSGANGCVSPGQIIRTWTLTDDCGNTVSQNQTITLVNMIPASFTAPPAVTINCEDDATDLSLTGDVTNEFSPCATNQEATFSDNNSGLTGCNGTGQIVRTWTLDDGCSSPVTHTQIITVVDNESPTFTAPAEVTINCEDDPTNLALTGDVTDESDNCSTILAATFKDDLTGLNGCNSTGEIIRTWTLADDCGNTLSQNQTITVVDDTPPTFTVPGPITINCVADPTDLSLTGDVIDESDNCSTNLEATFTDDNSGANGCISPSQIIRTWTLTDDCGNTLSQNQTITLVNSIPASFTVPPAITINCEDNPANLTLTGDVTDEFSPCTTILDATISDNTSGLTGCNGTGQIIRTWTLDDGCSSPVIQSQIITVVDNTAPTFTVPAAVTISCEDDPINLTLTGDVTDESDNCSTSLNATFIDDLSGLTGCNGTGDITRTWILVDDCENMLIQNQTITVVDDTPPTFTVPDPITINCEDDPTDLSLTGDVLDEADNCSTNLAATFIDDLSRLIDCNGTGEIIRTWTLTDDCGNTFSQDQNINIVDVTPPNAICQAIDIQLDANGNATATASAVNNGSADNCQSAELLTLSISQTDFNCSHLGANSIILTVTDACGNAATCNTTVTVVDPIVPTLVCPDDVTIEANENDCENTHAWDVTFEDNCAGASVSSNPPSGTSFLLGTSEVTSTVVDAAGNESNCTFTVTVIDNIAPSLVCAADVVVRLDGMIMSDPDNIIEMAIPNNSCDGIMIQYLSPQGIDNCTAVPLSEDVSPLPSGSTYMVGDNQIDFIATDDSGNQNTCSFNITIVALEEIEISSMPGTTLCEGETLSLSSDAMGGYSWSDPNNNSSTDEIFILENVNEANSGSYVLEVTLSSGCKVSETVDITVNPAPAFMASSNTPVCDGNLVLTATPDASSPGVDTWSWTGPCGFTSSDQNVDLNGLSEDCEGVYTLVAITAAGCSTSAAMAVDLLNLPPPSLALGCDESICITESCFIFGTAFSPAPDEYHWAADPNAGLPAVIDQNGLEISPLASGQFTYQYWITRDGCNSDTASIDLAVLDRPEVNDDEFDVSYQTPLQNFTVTDNDNIVEEFSLGINVTSSTAHGSLFNTPDGQFTYTPDNGFVGIDSFYYQVCYNCDERQCETALVELRVNFEGECEVPNIITPNGDGINDVLEIVCLYTGDYPNNDLIIFNQWGDRVFSASPYLNDWDGTLYGKEGKDLPDATYYYIFKPTPDSDADAGYIMILR